MLAAFVNTMENETHTPMNQLLNNMIFQLGNRIHSIDNKSLLILIGTNISEGTIDNIDEVANSIELIKKKYPFSKKEVPTSLGTLWIYKDLELAFDIRNGKVHEWFLYNIN